MTAETKRRYPQMILEEYLRPSADVIRGDQRPRVGMKTALVR